MDKAKLFVLSGSQAGEDVSFGDTLTIGRSNKAGLPLKDSSISREHARVFCKEGQWVVVDLKSSNGTKVNGLVITRENLFPGDELTVGEIRLRFQLVGMKDPEPQPAPTPTTPEEKPASTPTPAAPTPVPEPESDEMEITWSDDIELPGADEKPASPPPTTPAKPAPKPVATPPTPQPRRLGDPTTNTATPAPTSPRRLTAPGSQMKPNQGGGLMKEDLSQWGGLAKTIALLLLLALGATLAYFAFTFAAGN